MAGGRSVERAVRAPWSVHRGSVGVEPIQPAPPPAPRQLNYVWSSGGGRGGLDRACVLIAVLVQAAFGREAETSASLRAGLEGRVEGLGIENQVLRERVGRESQLGQRAAGGSVARWMGFRGLSQSGGAQDVRVSRGSGSGLQVRWPGVGGGGGGWRSWRLTARGLVCWGSHAWRFARPSAQTDTSVCTHTHTCGSLCCTHCGGAGASASLCTGGSV